MKNNVKKKKFEMPSSITILILAMSQQTVDK